MGHLKTFLVVGLAMILGVATMWGQISASTGAIRGLTVDPSGAAVPGATVTLTNADTGVVAGNAKTASGGEFVFPLVVPGNYRIQIRATGFSTTVLGGIVVQVTKVTFTKATLKIGQVSSEVQVTGAAQTVDTSTATTGDVEEAREIKAIPLPTRNFLDLITEQAGVTATMVSAAVVGEGSPTVEVAGQRSINNNNILDGIDANAFSGFSLATVPVPNPDAVEEFRVNTSMYDASQGHSSGASINAIIKSGTDQFHGDIFEFNRNTDYNANDFFFNARGAARPVLQQNQFGGTVGGPVPKVKDTFWFFSYEGTRQNNAVSSAVSGSEPVLPARTSGESTATYTAALATAFNIPQASIDPVAVKTLLTPGQYGGYLFASGSCPSCAPGTIGNVAIALPTVYDANQYVLSLDHQFTASNRFSLKYFTSLASEVEPTGGTTLGQGENLPADNYHFAVSDFDTITPSLLNEFDAGATWVYSGDFPVNSVTVQQIGETKWDSSFGAVADSIPNFVFPSGADAQSFGGANTNGSVHGGTASITVNDTVSWVHGNHTLRFGIQSTRYQWNYENDYAETGEIEFANFDSFLTGSPELLFVSTGLHYNDFRDQNISEFVQDDYHVTRNLTLNLGLRYDYIGWPYDVLNRIGDYDPNLIPPGCVAGGGGSCMQEGFIAPAGATNVGTPGVTPDMLLSSNDPKLAPRIGFSDDIFGNGKLALRGGYGIFNITDSSIPILQLNAGPPVLDLYQVSVSGESDVLANPWPSGLLLPSQYPTVPPMGQFEGTFNANGTPQFLNSAGQSVPLVGNYSMNRDLIHSYDEEWNLNAQYSPAKDWLIELGYIGSRAYHLLDEDPQNQAVLVSASQPLTFSYTPVGSSTPVTTTITTNSAANADLRVAELGISPGGNTEITNDGFSYYDGMIAELRHSFAHGFQFALDYTWSKSIDNVSGIGGFVVNPGVPYLSKADSDFNEPQRLVFTYNWNLPGPRTGWAGGVFGGWEWSGVYTVQSGLPFTVTSTTGGTLEGLAGKGTANLGQCAGPVVNPGSTVANLSDYLNSSCFAKVPALASGTVVNNLTPLQAPGSESFTVGPTASGDPGTGSLLGDGPRNGWQGPRDSDLDTALMKNIPLRALGEQGNVQLRFEAFKALNNVNFSSPSANINSSTFGFITSTLDNTGRIIQLAAKISF